VPRATQHRRLTLSNARLHYNNFNLSVVSDLAKKHEHYWFVILIIVVPNVQNEISLTSEVKFANFNEVYNVNELNFISGFVQII